MWIFKIPSYSVYTLVCIGNTAAHGLTMQSHTVYHQCLHFTFQMKPTDNRQEGPKASSASSFLFYCFLSRLKEADFVMSVHKEVERAQVRICNICY